MNRLNERSINVWTQKDSGKDQGAAAAEGSDNEQEVDGEIRGSILNRGVSFTSTEEFLSFLEEHSSDSEVGVALQPAALEMDNVCVEVERVGSLEKEGPLHDEAEFDNSWSLRTGRVVGEAAPGTALLNPVVRLKKLDDDAKLGSFCEPSQGREPGTCCNPIQG